MLEPILTLGIDTATATAALGLMRGSEALGELTFAAWMAQSEQLLPALDRLLTLQNLRVDDLALIAVSSGPGSFTGLRIGLATAKGLAQALKVPLVGVPTMTSYAARVTFWPGRVTVLIHDRRNLVYHGELAGTRFLCQEQVVTIEQVLAKLEQLSPAEKNSSLFMGSGAERYRDELMAKGVSVAPPALNGPSALTVALLGAQRFAETGTDELFTLEPRYIQRPLAELSLQEKDN